MSFYLRGMSFVDMAFLRKSDLSNGHVTYRRRKTGQLLSIAWTQEMDTLLKKYPPNPTSYLLPIICVSGRNDRNIYHNMSYNVNRNLKRVAESLTLIFLSRSMWHATAGLPLPKTRGFLLV